MDNIYYLLQKVRDEKPLVYHLTNFVTIYDCASVTKALGASPVMSYAKEEAEDMAAIASSVVLNIGTLTQDFVETMKCCLRSANKLGTPVLLDVCGAGATSLRDSKCLELLEGHKIDVVKGNGSEMARIYGEDVKTRGVDSGEVNIDLQDVALSLAKRYRCTAVVTGAKDIIANNEFVYTVSNGDPMMSCVVGTGCMASSMIGAFCAMSSDYVYASAAALCCFGIAAQNATKKCYGPASMKMRLIDAIYSLNEEDVRSMQEVSL